MTGPENYREAERLLSAGWRRTDGDNGIVYITPEPAVMAAAQVHATLALAAAFAELIDAASAAGWDAIIEDRPLGEAS